MFKVAALEWLILSVKVTWPDCLWEAILTSPNSIFQHFMKSIKIKCLSAPSMNCERTHHHKKITQTWQRHKRKEMEVREKLLSQLKENIFSCEWSLNVSWRLFFMHQSPLLEPSSIYPSGKKKTTLTSCRSLAVTIKNTGFFCFFVFFPHCQL